MVHKGDQIFALTVFCSSVFWLLLFIEKKKHFQFFAFSSLYFLHCFLVLGILHFLPLLSFFPTPTPPPQKKRSSILLSTNSFACWFVQSVSLKLWRRKWKWFKAFLFCFWLFPDKKTRVEIIDHYVTANFFFRSNISF